MFETYIDAEGEQTLEEVFFGKLKTGVGNYSARNSAGGDRVKFIVFKHSLSVPEHKSAPKRELARRMLDRQKGDYYHFVLGPVSEDETDRDVDSFIRKYDRWAAKQRFTN